MAENDTPTDDLRSLLSASFDEAMTPVADPVVEPKADVAADKTADIEPKEPKADKPRASDGKFAKKDVEPADKTVEPKADDEKPKDEPKPDAKKEGEEKTDDKTKDEPKATDAKGPPENWSASDKALFKLQTPDAQAFLLRRHSAMEADYTKKVGAIADLKKEFEPIQQMFAPHLDVLKAKGLSPASTIRAWANVETALANGRGVDIVKGMVQSYGIDKAALGKALGFTSQTADQPATETKKDATADPANTALQPITLPPELAAELRELRAKIDSRENNDRQAQLAAARDREAKTEADITNFRSKANEKGELLHPYFEEVEPAMIALASSYVASKQPIPPLADLYETAVWANPSTRSAMLASQKAAEQAKTAEEARAKAASARKAGSSVTGAPGSGQASKPVRGEISLREQLEEAAADLG